MKYPEVDKVTLIRGQYPVKTLFSAFGRTTETTLTAGLGYLISRFPVAVGKLFVRNGTKISEVLVEESEKDSGRYDVLIKTNKYDVLVEAKRGHIQKQNQIRKYLKSRKNTRLVLVDRGSLFKESWVRESVSSKKAPVAFVSWDEIYKTLKRLDNKTIRKSDAIGWAVSKDLCEFMRESGMSESKSKEIYIRDMSGESIDLFFRHHIYKCQPMFFKSATGNSYFAPYFTGKASRFFEEQSMIKLRRGITWMASVKHVEVIKKKNILNFLKKYKWPDHLNAARMAREQAKGDKEVLMMLLGDPFLVFVTPVEKGKLGIRGATGSQSKTFEQLFQAAGKGH